MCVRHQQIVERNKRNFKDISIYETGINMSLTTQHLSTPPLVVYTYADDQKIRFCFSCFLKTAVDCLTFPLDVFSLFSESYSVNEKQSYRKYDSELRAYRLTFCYTLAFIYR